MEPYPTEPGVENEYNQPPQKDLNRWNPSAQYYIFQWDCFGGGTQIYDSLACLAKVRAVTFRIILYCFFVFF